MTAKGLENHSNRVEQPAHHQAPEHLNHAHAEITADRLHQHQAKPAGEHKADSPTKHKAQDHLDMSASDPFAKSDAKSHSGFPGGEPNKGNAQDVRKDFLKSHPDLGTGGDGPISDFKNLNPTKDTPAEPATPASPEASGNARSANDTRKAFQSRHPFAPTVNDADPVTDAPVPSNVPMS